MKTAKATDPYTDWPVVFYFESLSLSLCQSSSRFCLELAVFLYFPLSVSLFLCLFMSLSLSLPLLLSFTSLVSLSDSLCLSLSSFLFPRVTTCPSVCPCFHAGICRCFFLCVCLCPLFFLFLFLPMSYESSSKSPMVLKIMCQTRWCFGVSGIPSRAWN